MASIFGQMQIWSLLLLTLKLQFQPLFSCLPLLPNPDLTPICPYASPKYLLSCWLLFLSRPQLSALSRQAPNGHNMGNWCVMCKWDDFPAASPSRCLSRRHQSGVVHGQSTSSTGLLVWLGITSIFWLNNVVFIAWNNSIHLLTGDQGDRLLHPSQTPETM